MKKTKIDWADSTWNPVTGCLHGCKYCYARRIAERFRGNAPVENTEICKWPFSDGEPDCGDCQNCNHILDEPFRCTSTYEYMRTFGINEGKIEPYPYGFNPTFHRYRLDEPQHWKKPRTIFVCSMADLFGDWVPDEWIEQVFDACAKAPQHRYMFLTKNPKRYFDLMDKGIVMPNIVDWRYGYTIDGAKTVQKPFPVGFRSFVSIEPIQGRLSGSDIAAAARTEWVILGAETGNRKGKVTPEKEWIEEILERCDVSETPVFMKESLRELMGEDFRQEIPWEV